MAEIRIFDSDLLKGEGLSELKRLERKIRVSIIVRTVLRRFELKRALNSIKAQSYKEIELVLVNNSLKPLDEELESLAKSVAKYTNIVHEPIPGRSRAANAGLRAVSGEYILFLDEDDELLPDHISKLLDAAVSGGYEVVYTGVEGLDRYGNRVKLYDEPWEIWRFRGMNFLPIHSVLFSQEACRGIFFDESLELLEDWDFWLALSNDRAFYHIPGVSAIYHLESGESGLSAKRDLASLRSAHAAVWNKWRVRWGDEELSASIIWLETLVEHYRKESEYLLREREEILGSRSWRYTRFLRDGNRWLKDILERVKDMTKAHLWRRMARSIRYRGVIQTLYHISTRLDRLFSNDPLRASRYEAKRFLELFDHSTERQGAIEVQEPISIIIPIYNGYEFIEALFDSIKANTQGDYRLLVCDDASSDARIYPLLRKIQADFNGRMQLWRHEDNLGFIRTVNELAKRAPSHFVLLNSDTELPSGWLKRLMAPIFADEKVASVTPFTNAGTICSFPNYLEDNELFGSLSLEQIDEVFRLIDWQKHSIEVPTGVGFCMAINKRVVEEIGFFDEIYGRGYGEENDWSQRAIEAGYRNIHLSNLFVYHKHGGSFESEEKKRLIERNLKILRERYPKYDQQILKTIREDRLAFLRGSVAAILESRSRNSLMIFDHGLGGGASYYVEQLIEKHLQSGGALISVRFDFHKSRRFLFELKTPQRILALRAKEFEELSRVLNYFHVDTLLINSLVGYPDYDKVLAFLQRITRNSVKQTIVALHDFFPLCPVYNLIDSSGRYCGIPNQAEQCRHCLSLRKDEYSLYQSERDIVRWRAHWRALLEAVHEIRAFSQSSKEIFERVYPDLSYKVRVIPHQVPKEFENIYQPASNKRERIIGILGAINEAKGLGVIRELLSVIEERGIDAKVVVIGELSEAIDSRALIVTGRYDRKRLPELVKSYEIDLFLIPSIWPETFSYTTEEIMQMGYPLIVFNLGAPAERVAKYPLGRVIEREELIKELFGEVASK